MLEPYSLDEIVRAQTELLYPGHHFTRSLPAANSLVSMWVVARVGSWISPSHSRAVRISHVSFARISLKIEGHVLRAKVFRSGQMHAYAPLISELVERPSPNRNNAQREAGMIGRLVSRNILTSSITSGETTAF